VSISVISVSHLRKRYGPLSLDDESLEVFRGAVLLSTLSTLSLDAAINDCNRSSTATCKELPRGRPRSPDSRENRPDQARSTSVPRWHRNGWETTVEWAPWRGCDHA
jgi:hypothetical protein